MNDLLENGFLVASEDYLAWVGAEEESFVATRADPHGETDATAEGLLQSRNLERAKTLRISELERELRELQRRARAKTRRTRALKRDLVAHKQRTAELEGKLRASLRRLQGFKLRVHRLKQRNNRLKQRVETLEKSRVWRFISIIRTTKAGLARLWPN